jgi:hypothetical protein
VFEGSAEGLEVRLEEPDISTHYAEMGNLLTLDPKIHSLCAHSKKYCSFSNGHREILDRRVFGVEVNVTHTCCGARAYVLRTLYARAGRIGLVGACFYAVSLSAPPSLW